MKSYNFFRKTLSLIRLNSIFLKSKFVFFTNPFLLNSSYWVKTKKLFSSLDVHFCLFNKSLLKKKFFILNGFLNSSSFIKSSLLVVYSFNFSCEKLVTNDFLLNGLFNLFLCSYFCKRFMFLTQFQYYLKKSRFFFLFELYSVLSYFLSKSFYFILHYKKTIA